MSDVVFKPLLIFPRPFTKARRAAVFRSSYQQTLDLLEYELDSIKARNAVIQLKLSARNIRRDGYPRADAVPDHPGVLLTFQKWFPNGRVNEENLPLGIYHDLSMASDEFDDWKDNLRGIALSLEALRKIDRFGVTQGIEQYRGFAALPPVAPQADTSEDFASRVAAADWLAKQTDFTPSQLLNGQGHLRVAVRDASRKLHPDAGGAPADFRRLQNARKVLGI